MRDALEFAIGALIAIGFAFACSAPIVALSDMAADVVSETIEQEDAAEQQMGGGGSSGSLPPGFYQRGCQWDRPCDDFPTRQAPASNPLR